MNQLCRHAGLKLPEFKNDQGWFSVIFSYPCVLQHNPCGFSDDSSLQVARLVAALGRRSLSAREILDILALREHDNFVKSYLQPALRDGIAELTIPEKHRHPQQRYRLTLKGLSYYQLYQSGR